ncbi:MAG TPA: hypothetical protein VGF76_01520 [Polyangiaceae bacterium]
MTQSSNPTSNGAAPVVAAPEGLPYPEAFQQALLAAQAVPEDELITINIDLPTAVTTAVGTLPQILALRDRVVAELPKFDISHFDLLKTYTLAAAHAHSLYAAASAPPAALVALNTAGLTLRDTLYSDAVALVNRGLISGEKLGDFKSNVGYKNLAFDLMGLVALLRGNWDKIKSKTALTSDELDQAERLGGQLVDAVGAREQAPAAVLEVSLQRQRNFTLFANSYGQARRAISYLRWDEQDVDTIAPSLYAGRNTTKKKDTTQPTAPAPVAGTAPIGSAAAGKAPLSPAPAVAAPVINTPVAAGLPGSSPFSVS